MTFRVLPFALAIVGVCPASPGRAQQAHPAAATITAGYAGFVDEGAIHHTVLGAGAEWRITPRVTVGPDVLYMVGPGDDRDLFVLGLVHVGLRGFDARVVPFIVGGAGVMRHSDSFGGRTFSSVEGAFVAGAGVRVALTPRVFVAPEVALGWEPHLRASVKVGIRLP